MAKITVQRKAGGYTDRLRKYKVLVDGQEVGKVGAGKSVSAEVDAGPHDVQLKIDWARSPAMSVQVSSEEEVRLHCQAAANPFTVLYYTTVGMNRYIKLERP